MPLPQPLQMQPVPPIQVYGQQQQGQMNDTLQLAIDGMYKQGQLMNDRARIGVMNRELEQRGMQMAWDQKKHGIDRQERQLDFTRKMDMLGVEGDIRREDHANRIAIGGQMLDQEKIRARSARNLQNQKILHENRILDLSLEKEARSNAYDASKINFGIDPTAAANSTHAATQIGELAFLANKARDPANQHAFKDVPQWHTDNNEVNKAMATGVMVLGDGEGVKHEVRYTHIAEILQRNDEDSIFVADQLLEQGVSPEAIGQLMDMSVPQIHGGIGTTARVPTMDEQKQYWAEETAIAELATDESRDDAIEKYRQSIWLSQGVDLGGARESLEARNKDYDVRLENTNTMKYAGTGGGPNGSGSPVQSRVDALLNGVGAPGGPTSTPPSIANITQPDAAAPLDTTIATTPAGTVTPVASTSVVDAEVATLAKTEPEFTDPSMVTREMYEVLTRAKDAKNAARRAAIGGYLKDVLNVSPSEFGTQPTSQLPPLRPIQITDEKRQEIRAKAIKDAKRRDGERATMREVMGLPPQSTRGKF